MEAEYLREQESEQQGGKGVQSAGGQGNEDSRSVFQGRICFPMRVTRAGLPVAPTEHVHLEMRRLEEDFNFIMERTGHGDIWSLRATVFRRRT